jgi:hypothetical protein
MLAEEGAFDVRPAGCVARCRDGVPYVIPQIRARGRVGAVWKQFPKGIHSQEPFTKGRCLGQEGVKGRVETLVCKGTIVRRGPMDRPDCQEDR